jgi:cyclic lactone autoinducer peptide
MKPVKVILSVIAAFIVALAKLEISSASTTLLYQPELPKQD